MKSSFKTIALIDDDMDDAEIFKDVLNEVAPETTFTHYQDCNEAITDFSSLSEPLPDLLFLDINMPTLSGWQCLSKLKASSDLKDIPVVMYSTSSQPREIQISEDLGALAFVKKPHDFKQLKKILNTFVSKPVDHINQKLIDSI